MPMDRPSLESIFGDATPTAPQPMAASKDIPQMPTQRPSLDSIFGGDAAQPTQSAPIKAPEGFFDRVGADIGKRAQMAQDIKGRAGAQPIGETALQAVGGVGAGLMNDVVGEAAKSAYGMLPDAVKSKIESNPVVKMGVSMAQKGAETYTKWAQQNPRAARDVEATVNIASLFPIAKPVGKVAETAVSPATNIVKGAIAPSADKMAKIVDTMHKSATATIEKVKASGMEFHPDAIDNMTDAIAKIPDLKTAGERSVRPETSAVVDEIKKSLTTGENSINNILGFRDRLTQIIGKGGADGATALEARKAIDATIANGEIKGAKIKGIPMVTEFRSQWARYKTGEDVAAAATLAAESPAKSRKAFQKIVDSEFFKGLSPEVQRLTKIAAKGKASGKFFDTVGSITNLLGASKARHLPLLEAGGALLYGHPEVAAGIGGAMAASKAGRLTQQGISADVLRALQENK